MAARIMSVGSWEERAECTIVITRSAADEVPPEYLKDARIMEPYALVFGDSP